MFNLKLEPKEFRRIKHGTIEVDLPVYEDLLGAEYDIIEASEYAEMQWNIALVELTEKLAKSRGLNLMDVTRIIGEAENQNPTAQLELLGEFMPEFVRISNSRPSPRASEANLVLAMLHRVNKAVTLDDVYNLPRKFFQEILAFAFQEQQGGNLPAYKDLIVTAQNAQEETRKIRDVLDNINKLLRGVEPNSKQIGQVKKLVDNYYLSLAEVGK